MADSPIEEASSPTVRPATGARVSVATAAVLLLVGGLVGYSMSLPATQRATPTTMASAVAAPVAAAAAPSLAMAQFDWKEQRPDPLKQRAWGVVAAVELDEVLFLLAFEDFQTSEQRVLWRSANGIDWTLLPLDFGRDVIVDDLDVYEGGLLLTGWNSGAPTIWRSDSPMARDVEWNVISLPTEALPMPTKAVPQPTEAVPLATENTGNLEEIRTSTAEIVTQINEAGEIVIASRVSGDITEMLLTLAGDPDAESLLHLENRPEIAASGQRLWAQVVGADGTTIIETLTIPSTVILEPTSGDYVSDVGLLTWGSLWMSSDGRAFAPVDLRGLPNLPTPEALGDGFVSAVERADRKHELWSSADGSHWTRTSLVPPSPCGTWESLAVGANRMMVSTPSFNLMCVSATGQEWEVHESPETAVSSTGSVWVEGVSGGFVAVVQNLSEFAVLISEDGLEWNMVAFEPGTVGAHAMLVGNRMVASSLMMQPGEGRRFSVWVGTPIG